MSRIQKAQGRTTFTQYLVHKTTGEKLARITTTIAVEDLREDTSQDTLIHRADAIMNDRYINVQPGIYSTEELNQLPAEARVLLPIAVLHKMDKQEKMDAEANQQMADEQGPSTSKGKSQPRRSRKSKEGPTTQRAATKRKTAEDATAKTKKIILEENNNIRHGEGERNTSFRRLRNCRPRQTRTTI